VELSIDVINKATDNFKAERKISSGSTGEVYAGELVDGTPIAIKRIDVEALKASGWTEDANGFEEEVRVLSKIRHQNIVLLMGFVRTPMYNYLVYEYMPGGDVKNRLRASREGVKEFLWYERMTVLHDAAMGLNYMHNFVTPKTFHRDIKMANILLDKAGRAKMADFGLACVSTHPDCGLSDALRNHATVRFTSGTPGYTDPNYLGTGKVTEANEVYSFGICMLEMLTNISPSRIWNGKLSFPLNEVLDLTLPGVEERTMMNIDERAQFPSVVSKKTVQLAVKAVTLPTHERPLFQQLSADLKVLDPNAQRKSAVGSSPGQVDHTLLPSDWTQFPPNHGMARPQVQQQQHMKAADGNAPIAANGAMAHGAVDGAGNHNPMQTVLPNGFGASYGASSTAQRQTTATSFPIGDAGARGGGDNNPATLLNGVHLVNATPSESSTAAFPELKIKLKVVKALDVDLEALPSCKKTLTLHSGDCVGRQFQPEAFQALAPDQNNLVAISRRHFEVVHQGDTWVLRNMSMNPLKVNNEMISQHSTAELANLSRISFLPRTHSAEMSNTPFLEFCVWDVESTRPSQIEGNRAPIFISNAPRLEGISENASSSHSPLEPLHPHLGVPPAVPPISANANATILPTGTHNPVNATAHRNASACQTKYVVIPPPRHPSSSDDATDAYEDLHGASAPDRAPRDDQDKDQAEANEVVLPRENEEVEDNDDDGGLRQYEQEQRSGADHGHEADRIRDTQASGRYIAAALSFDAPPCLICTFSKGMNLSAMDARACVLPIEEGLHVGRKHQTMFFENLIENKDLLVCISRAHFELTYEQGEWIVTSTSCNPLYVDNTILANGNHTKVHHGSLLCFIPPQQDNEQEPFLQLQAKLENKPLPAVPSRGTRRRTTRPVHDLAPTTNTSTNITTYEAAVSDACAQYPTQYEHNDDTNNDESNVDHYPTQHHLHAVNSPAAPVMINDNLMNMPTFTLEVRHAESLELSQLDDMDRILSSEVNTTTFTVGRSLAGPWFKDLLAVSPSFLVFVAREHIRLRFDPRTNTATIENLCKNPVYVNRTLLDMNVPIPIRHGARISFATTSATGIEHFLRFKLWINSLPLPAHSQQAAHARSSSARDNTNASPYDTRTSGGAGGGFTNARGMDAASKNPNAEVRASVNGGGAREARNNHLQPPNAPPFMRLNESSEQVSTPDRDTGSPTAATAANGAPAYGAASSTSPPYSFGTPVFGPPATFQPSTSSGDKGYDGAAPSYQQKRDAFMFHGSSKTRTALDDQPVLGNDGNEYNHDEGYVPEQEVEPGDRGGGDPHYLLGQDNDPPPRLRPGEVCLEIRGRAVKPGTPVDERRIYWAASHSPRGQHEDTTTTHGGPSAQQGQGSGSSPSSSSLTVGRRPQLALHRECLYDSYQVYVSREHFRLDRTVLDDANGGAVAIMLTPLAINPMYLCSRPRDRMESIRDDGGGVEDRANGISSDQLPKEQPVRVYNGDELLLFTGQTPLFEWLYWRIWIDERDGAAREED